MLRLLADRSSNSLPPLIMGLDGSKQHKSRPFDFEVRCACRRSHARSASEVL